jgi:SIT4-associating protein SAP185/190
MADDLQWLFTKDVMPTLLSCLGPQNSWATQTSAGDFMKAIITVSANASQNEQACIGPNELTRQLVSRPCIEQLIGYMLGGGNPLAVGVGIIIEVIRKNNSDYDPEVSTDSSAPPSSRDPIYLGTLLRLFAEHVPDFMTLIMNAPTQKERIDSTFGKKIEPLGFDRFKTCELMAELLHCSNMALLNEVGSEEVIARRDAERRRLRDEGKLALNRGEEPQSPEDLSMPLRQSSPEDGRRLEVTNASEDDGFEEVAPSGEMTEDTSHEFVKAEEEIPAGPSSSFLDKDDDDFVDEPLSSPRLNPRSLTVHEQHQEFENPELVVAPLSPRKAPATTVQPSATPEGGQEIGPVSDAGSTQGPADVDITLPDVQTPDDSEVQEPKSETSQSETVETNPEKDVDAALGTETIIGSMDQSIPQPLIISKEPTQGTIAPGDGPEGQGGETSMIDGPPAEAVQSSASPQIDPVVGDLLKMQFVKHQVVPSILVGPTRYLIGLGELRADHCLGILLQIPLEQLSP